MGIFSRTDEKKAAKASIAEEKKNAKTEKELANEEKVKNGKTAIKNLNGAKEHFEDDEELLDYILECMIANC